LVRLEVFFLVKSGIKSLIKEHLRVEVFIPSEMGLDHLILNELEMLTNV